MILLPLFSATNPLRMHMPGHKGDRQRSFFLILRKLTLLRLRPRATSNTGEGPIAEAEHLCAAYAGAKEALFYTCGSTQGIHTMLLEAVVQAGI